MEKLAIFLLLLSSAAWAEWKSVGDENGAAFYADAATIVRSGSTAKQWSLLDYKAFQRMVEVGYFSQKALVEYDCAERKARGLSLSLHAEHMGEGKVIYEDTSPHEWEPVLPETITEMLWNIACK
jgi:surface-adhesin protein E